MSRRRVTNLLDAHRHVELGLRHRADLAVAEEREAQHAEVRPAQVQCVIVAHLLTRHALVHKRRQHAQRRGRACEARFGLREEE